MIKHLHFLFYFLNLPHSFFQGVCRLDVNELLSKHVDRDNYFLFKIKARSLSENKLWKIFASNFLCVSVWVCLTIIEILVFNQYDLFAVYSDLKILFSIKYKDLSLSENKLQKWYTACFIFVAIGCLFIDHCNFIFQ